MVFRSKVTGSQTAKTEGGSSGRREFAPLSSARPIVYVEYPL